jgi:hypothetical protein
MCIHSSIETGLFGSCAASEQSVVWHTCKAKSIKAGMRMGWQAGPGRQAQAGRRAVSIDTHPVQALLMGISIAA